MDQNFFFFFFFFFVCVANFSFFFFFGLHGFPIGRCVFRRMKGNFLWRVCKGGNGSFSRIVHALRAKNIKFFYDDGVFYFKGNRELYATINGFDDEQKTTVRICGPHFQEITNMSPDDTQKIIQRADRLLEHFGMGDNTKGWVLLKTGPNTFEIVSKRTNENNKATLVRSYDGTHVNTVVDVKKDGVEKMKGIVEHRETKLLPAASDKAKPASVIVPKTKEPLDDFESFLDSLVS